MKIAFIYVTEKSKMLCNNLESNFRGDIIKYSEFRNSREIFFEKYDFIVFVMATGIVVRTISPVLRDKFTDPGVIVIDELGKNVISLLSGHIGGANELTLEIASYLGSNPVITTATDINSKGAFDLVVKEVNAKLENLRELSLEINKYLLKDMKVDLYIQDDYKDIFYDKNGELKQILNGFDVRFIGDIDSEIFSGNSKKIILISDWDIEQKIKKKNIGRSIINNESFVVVVPVFNVMGVGCRRNTESTLFEKTVLNYLYDAGIDINSIAEISSIDVKEDEPCILNLAKKYEINTKFYSKEEISDVDYLFEKSEFVKKNVGVYSVSEPSCYLSSEGNIIENKFKGDGMTLCLGRNINRSNKIIER